jgi:hypothetical protein
MASFESRPQAQIFTKPKVLKLYCILYFAPLHGVPEQMLEVLVDLEPRKAVLGLLKIGGRGFWPVSVNSEPSKVFVLY